MAHNEGDPISVQHIHIHICIHIISIAEFSDTLMPYLSVEFEQLKFFLMLNFNIRKFALLKLNIRVFFECEYKQKVLC